jgi:hypothetical protein
MRGLRQLSIWRYSDPSKGYATQRGCCALPLGSSTWFNDACNTRSAASGVPLAVEFRRDGFSAVVRLVLRYARVSERATARRFAESTTQELLPLDRIILWELMINGTDGEPMLTTCSDDGRPPAAGLGPRYWDCRTTSFRVIKELPRGPGANSGTGEAAARRSV